MDNTLNNTLAFQKDLTKFFKIMITKQLRVLTNRLAYVMAFTLCITPLVSCDSDDDNSEAETETEVTTETQDNLITLDRLEVDFGEVVANSPSGKAASEDTQEIVTLTNNSNERLVGLETAINFPGNAAVRVTFSGLDPGESVDVVLSFGPSNLGPGMYTGTATLTPSIGTPITVDLSATVVPAPTTEDIVQSGLITVSSTTVDFGQVNANSNSAKGQSEDKQVVITLTNNSNERLIGLSSSINFPGNAAVSVTFKGLDPGESVDVFFSFGPSNLGPGVYTGTATLTPSIGDPILMDLRAEVI